jgi:hypothetical protein
METPQRRIEASKFVFLSDQKSVPTDLRKLQEHTMKRRRGLFKQGCTMRIVLCLD